MIYELTSVSKLWPDRVRTGRVIVPDDRAAIASFNRTWTGSPDLVRAELKRTDGVVLAGGVRVPMHCERCLDPGLHCNSTPNSCGCHFTDKR